VTVEKWVWLSCLGCHAHFLGFFRLRSAGAVAATYLLLFLILVVVGLDISAVKGTLYKNLIFDRNLPPNAH